MGLVMGSTFPLFTQLPLITLGRFGEPDPGEAFLVGNVAVCFLPAPLAPAHSLYFVLTSSVPISPPPLLPGFALPWSVSVAAPLIPVTVTLQTVVLLGSNAITTRPFVVDVR